MTKVQKLKDISKRVKMSIEITDKFSPKSLSDDVHVVLSHKEAEFLYKVLTEDLLEEGTKGVTRV